MTLESVGQYLQAETFARTIPAEKDVFGRSSFNRYYYATFLEARSLLAAFREEWAVINHASIPEVLRGTIVKEFKVAKTRASRIGDKETLHGCSNAISAAKDLADLMQQGYAIRVVADYQPETPVAFLASDAYSLNEISIKIARHWPGKAKALANSIAAANRLANVF